MSYRTLIPPSAVPEGQRGRWAVERFTVSETDARWSALRDGRRSVSPGTYTRLVKGRHVVMSDTPAELRDHYEFVHRARGSVLINGLGLGVCVAAVLQKPEVEQVRVVEIDADVIELVGPHLTDPRLAIVHADALAYQPARGERFNVVWHDIWPDLCAGNLEQMATLKRRYARRTDWQGCWGEAECRMAKRRWR